MSFKIVHKPPQTGSSRLGALLKTSSPLDMSYVAAVTEDLNKPCGISHLFIPVHHQLSQTGSSRLEAVLKTSSPLNMTYGTTVTKDLNRPIGVSHLSLKVVHEPPQTVSSRLRTFLKTSSPLDMTYGTAVTEDLNRPCGISHLSLKAVHEPPQHASGGQVAHVLGGRAWVVLVHAAAVAANLSVYELGGEVLYALQRFLVRVPEHFWPHFA